MGETTPSQMKLGKMASRNVVIALGIICIILAASLVGTTVYLASTVNGKNSTINQEDSVIADLNDTLNLQKHTIWVDNQTVNQTPDSYNSWVFTVNVSGYVLVFTETPTNNAYVRVIYNSTIPAWDWEEIDNGPIINDFQGVWDNFIYDNQVNATHGGVFNVFPLLSSYDVYPTTRTAITSTDVEIRVGNTNSIGNTTQTVTIIYFC